MGREFRQTCEQCGATETYHVDDVHASANRAKAVALFAAVVVSGVATLVLWNIGWVSTIPLIVCGGAYLTFLRTADTKADAFNAYEIGRGARP